MLKLRPELFFAGIFHFSLAFWTGVLVPKVDVIAATLQAETADLAAIGGGDIGYDTTNDEVLNGLAVGAGHGDNLLTEQSTAVIYLCLVAAGLTTIFLFPSHLKLSAQQRATVHFMNVLTLVDVFVVAIFVARELKEVVGNATDLELANLDGGVENTKLDAHTHGVAVLLV